MATRSKVDVSFTDSLDKDFYKVLVLTRYGKDQPFRSTYTSVNEPGSVESARASGVLFGDQSFDGQDKTMSFQFYRITEQQAKGNIQLRWRNVSESYFKYSKTANVHFESRDNPFATPSDIFTNIEGGLGYFFLHNQRTYNVPQPFKHVSFSVTCKRYLDQSSLQKKSLQHLWKDLDDLDIQFKQGKIVLILIQFQRVIVIKALATYGPFSTNI